VLDAALTYQERRVLELIAHGLDAYTAAWHLRISAHTVKSHTKAIRRKLDAPTTAAAIGQWRRAHAPDPIIAAAVAQRRRLPPCPGAVQQRAPLAPSSRRTA
jgi:DNA-binding CsgD family transcriptional regulator